MSLLAELVAKGHRTLIFSQSRVMLDILQAAIRQQAYPFRRIDGSISSATDRQVSCSLPCLRTASFLLVLSRLCLPSWGSKRGLLPGLGPAVVMQTGVHVSFCSIPSQ